MPTGQAAIPHYDNTTPAAPTGCMNVDIQQGAPYSGTLVWNGQNYTVQFTDISWNVPNIGGVDARTTTTETIGLASQGMLVTLSNASPIAVTLDSTVPNSFYVAVSVTASGLAVLTPATGQIEYGGSLQASLTLTDGQGIILFFDGTNWQVVGFIAVPPYTNGSFGITIDGGGTTPATGSKGYLQAPFDCTITGWTVLADQSGSAQITVKKSTYSGFPTTASIVASAPPLLSSAQKNTSTTLTGWTTAVSLGDVLEFNLDSATTVTRIYLKLQVTRSD